MIWTPDRQASARATCALWAGTPHRHRIAVPGQGIDCLRFVFEVLIAADICERFTLPAYNPNLGMLRETNIMEALLLDHLHAHRVEPGELPDFGDILIFECGLYSNHMGIVIDGQLWHTPGRGRVGPAALSTIMDVQSIIRITMPGFTADPRKLTWEQIINKKA